MTIGTGISAALVLYGRPFLGTRGATGTIASSPLSQPCDGCGESTKLTLEEIASGPGITTRYNAIAGRKLASAVEVAAAAGEGNPYAIRIMWSAGESVGATLGLLVNTLDPEAIVIGGGLGLSGGIYWESLVESTRRHIWSGSGRALPLLKAVTGADAGWIGAAVAAFHETVHGGSGQSLSPSPAE